MSTLWIYFIVFAVLGVATFLYAFRALGSSEEAEKRVMELQHTIEEEG